MKEGILIAEDDFANGLAAMMAMKELNLDTDLVTNAKEVIEKIEEKAYVAVITDLNMPLAKDEVINPKAGEVVVKACAKKMIPVFVVTAGILHHGGTHNIVDILFAHNLYGNSNAEPKFDWQRQLRGQKDVEMYKEVWRTIKENFEPVLAARRRYIKYVLI